MQGRGQKWLPEAGGHAGCPEGSGARAAPGQGRAGRRDGRSAARPGQRRELGGIGKATSETAVKGGLCMPVFPLIHGAVSLGKE